MRVVLVLVCFVSCAVDVPSSWSAVNNAGQVVGAEYLNGDDDFAAPILWDRRWGVIRSAEAIT